MKKFYLMMSLFVAVFTGHVNAQTILDEDFEIGNPEGQNRIARGEGWTTVNSYTGTKASYVWHNYYDGEDSSTPTISGKNCASCDGPTYSTAPDGGFGPREEILLSPELDLNGNYKLQFTWRVSPMNAYDNSKYDLQVRVVENDNLNGAETIFSIQSAEMLKESGVLTFPISTWDPRVSTLDLSDWKGKKVKLAFVYKMMTTVANVVWLDDISVKGFTPDTAPVPTLSIDRYNFGDVYIGEKFYTEVITLTNNGLNGLKVTGIDLPQGVATTLDPEKVNLDKYESVQFQFSYTASLTSPATGDAVIHTNGGDVKVALSATKQVVPEGFTLETFEQHYPPAGWKAHGWGTSNVAIEGDKSAYGSGTFDASYLKTPRLDLSKGGSIVFTYFNDFTSEDGSTLPEYDIVVEVSYDGGDTWTQKWVSDYMNTNVLETVTVDLGKGTDDSYVRWYYPAIEQDEEGYAYEHSSFTLDRVLLPNLYGADGVPMAASLESPANGTTDVYPRNIVLKWNPAQFADGYKVFVGSNATADNLVNGEMVNGLTYTIPVAAYETTYKWRVLPYNSKGEGISSSTWEFTTQPDASVMTFPYEENFDAGVIPAGWLSTTTITDDYPTWTNRCWMPLNTSKAYGGTGASMYTMWLYGGYSSTLTSPEFTLPAAGQEMSISFVWGDNHPVDLIVDETGLLKKQNVPGGNGYSDVVFEIFADGAWTQAAYLSENYNEDGDTKYWRNEKVDLSAYAGKVVQFRWINHSYSGSHRGAGLDNIVIDGIMADKVIFNKESWNAGKVNYECAVNSGDKFTMSNDGVNELKVKAVTFETEHFESSLTAGTVIPVGGGMKFNLQFSAKKAAAVINDVMTIEFESGYKATFPVTGEALPQNIYFQSFENNPLDHPWKDEFTLLDVDHTVNSELGYYETTVENDGGRYAFTSVLHNNSNLTAHSGVYTIGAAASETSSADDWIISKKMKATSTSAFDFYARNLGTTNSVYVGDNDYHNVGVYVSETGTAVANFTAVMADQQMDYLGENEWHHFALDLSSYAGKEIYIAVRHTELTANNMAFFDDFTFQNFDEAESTAIVNVNANVNANAEVEVYSVNGSLVSKGVGSQALQSLAKGLYVVKVKEGDEIRTLRVVRK